MEAEEKMIQCRPDSGTLLQLTRSFWNVNPCDGQADVFRRMEFRYAKEPWLPPVLDRIARHSSVLEVGCGQGTDAVYCCRRMSKEASYLALDYSDRSVASARKSAAQFREHLNVVPEFAEGNAESLDLPDESFACVVSIGVLHHTPDPRRAVDELYRVLKKGGTAYVALYRLMSPKVLAAHAVRLVARCVDRVAGRERYLYGLCRRLGSNHFLGTMLLECLGVPILYSYTRNQARKMFGRFGSVDIRPVGMGMPLGMGRWIDRGTNLLGALWLIEAVKNGSGPEDQGKQNADDL